MSDTTKGVAAAAASALALSTMGVLGKLLYRHDVDPLNVVTLRAAVAFFVLGLALVLVRGRLPAIRRRDIPLFVLLGLVGISLNYAGFFLSLKFTTVATAISILYTFPAFVILGAYLFLGEPVTANKAISLVLCFGGCLLVIRIFNADALQLNLWGIVFGFVASITKAVYTLAGKRALSTYDPWTVTFFAFGLGGLFLVIGTTSSGRLDVAIPAEAWAYVVGIALLPTLVGYSLFLLALKYLEAGKASIVATLEPVAAIALSAAIVGELITPLQSIGVAMVIGGVMLSQVKARKGRASSRPTDPSASGRS